MIKKKRRRFIYQDKKAPMKLGRKKDQKKSGFEDAKVNLSKTQYIL